MREAFKIVVLEEWVIVDFSILQYATNKINICFENIRIIMSSGAE